MTSEKLRDVMERFYGEIIENYKMAQREVMTESKFSSMFKKSNYPARIRTFNKIKKSASKLKAESDDENTELENDIIYSLQRCQTILQELCDAQILMQETLKAKANKERKVSMKEYSKVMKDVRAIHEKLQKSLHNLDIYYSQWLEEIAETY